MATFVAGQPYMGPTFDPTNPSGAKTQQQLDQAAGTNNAAGYNPNGTRIDAAATGYNGPITPSVLAPATPIVPPTPPVPTNPLPGGVTVPTPITSTTSTSEQKTSDTIDTEWITKLMNGIEQPSAVDTYQKDYAESGIANLEAERNAKKQAQKQAQDEFNAIQAQLQGVALEAQAIPIQVQQSAQEGGANVTKGGLSPIQTAALRNNALRAIPLQAQAYVAQAKLASAQGDTALAQDALNSATAHLDKIYQMHMADAQNAYNYKKDLRDKIYDYATKKEQQKIDALNRADDRAFTIKQNSISNAQSLSRLAIENGLSSTATQIAALDPSSPTYQQDLAKLQGEIAAAIKRKQDEATRLANQKVSKAPETVKVGETVMQWDTTQGKWVPIEAPGTTGGLDTQKSKDQFNLMFQTIDTIKAPEIYGASGRSEGRKFLQGMVYGPGDYGDLQALTNTLRTNMLTLQTDPNIKKFFGPQMSNADVQLMTAAGTTVNPELQSPEQLLSEVKRIQDLMVRARQSLDGVTQWSNTPDGTRIGLYPDGIIRDIDGNHYDGNGRKIYDAKTGKNL